ncbi:MAG TPA: hypothetical protein VIV40_42290 [Kofleriaceae bacterium]
MKKLLAALCCTIVVACATASRPQTQEVKPQTGQDASLLPASKRDQILELERKIDADRTTLALAEPAQTDYANTAAEPMGTKPATQNPTCRPAKTETCTSSCTLSDSICKNADSICRLAIEMNDDWARGRCAKANKTCEGSRTKCCGCQ